MLSNECLLSTFLVTCEHCQVSLRDLYKGKTSKMALTKDVICKTCDGRGGKKVRRQWLLEQSLLLYVLLMQRTCDWKPVFEYLFDRMLLRQLSIDDMAGIWGSSREMYRGALS